MVKNIIQLSVQAGKGDEVKEIYQRHFQALRAEGDKIQGYEIYVDDADDGVVFAVKTFDSAEDFERHSKSAALESFLAELKSVLAGPP